jgi:DNA-binding NarL/FixJ family response regulator
MTTQPLLIYLADDHRLIGEGIAAMLRNIETVERVDIFPNGKLLFKEFNKKRPDLVILDIEMPEWDGLTTLREIMQAYPETCVLMLSMLEERSIIEECISMGAKGYMHKDSKKEEFELALYILLHGGTFLSEEAKKVMEGKRMASVANVELIEPLTQRELEILKLICDGCTSKEIGEQLFLSPRTVETHKTHLMQKFNVHSTGKLISLAIKGKLVK